MPSALLKSSHPTAPLAANMDSQEPLKNAVLLLEKKLRNLEKRKGRIEGYEQLSSTGAKLNEDQLASLKQKEMLGHNMELVKELHKQMAQLCDDYQRQHKKEQKRARQELKEQTHKDHAHTITKVIEVRFLLDSLTDEVRPDFLSGTNGACLLTEDDFAKLDEIYKLINPAEDEDASSPLSVKVATACRHLQDLVDGKDKKILETTYADIYAILKNVNACGYFSKAAAEEAEAAEQEEAVDDGEHAVSTEKEQAAAPEHVEVEAVGNGAPHDLVISQDTDATQDEQQLAQSQMNAGSPEFVPRSNNQQVPDSAVPETRRVEQEPPAAQPEPAADNEEDDWKVSGGDQGQNQGSRQYKPRDGRGRDGRGRGGFRGGRGGRGGRGHDNNRPYNGAPKEGGQQRRGGGPPREGGYRGGRGGGGNRDQPRQPPQQ